MDLNRIRTLAGLEVLKESTLTENSHKIEAHVSKKGGMGVLGDVIVLDAFDGMAELAKILGIPDGWKLTKVNGGFAAYNSGDRMTFFSNKDDFDPEDSEEDQDQD